jgi:hypothetical protein
MKIAVSLLTAALILCGCTRFSDHGFDRTKLAADADKGAPIRLADYTSFDWDRVHIFAPYTPAEVIKEEVGSSVPFPHGDSEGYCLLVFLSQGKIAAAFEAERKPADFAELFRKGGYSREDASFIIATRASDGWRSLKPRQANQTPEPRRP